MLELDQNDFHTPGLGLGIEDTLDSRIDFLSFGKQLIEFRLAANAAQRHLGELRSGKKIIRDLTNGA